MDAELRGRVHDLVVGRESRPEPWKRGTRAILIGEARQLLEGAYGVHADGRIEPAERLPQLADDAEAAETYSRIVAHLAAGREAGLTAREAVDKLVKEVAFTHLNRLVAFKMMEARGLIRGTLAGYPKQPNAFLRYLAAHPEDEARFQAGEDELAFRRFLLWQAAQVAAEIRVLFDPDNLPSRLFPRRAALRDVIAMLNDESLAPAWAEDETIGWVYQYFNEREKAEVFERLYKQKQKIRRADVPAATQLFTPRWIVEFLVQNTLGRTWLQMHPDSALAERMELLVPLAGEIPTAELKPVREITALDPACGTMHFGMAAFDLLAEMYREELAHAGEPGWPAAASVGGEEEIPAAILAHNLFGIDIDLRAVQLAALGLYLKAKALNRDAALTATNLVSADVLPFRQRDLEAFLAEMRFTRPVYERVLRALWPKLAEVTELGSLARLEKHVSAAVDAERRREGENPLFAEVIPGQGPALSTEEQWEAVEQHILWSLDHYAKTAAERGADVTFFAGEAAKGMRLLDVMRRRYDVVLSNPPYLTNFTDAQETLLAQEYTSAKHDTYAAFILRCTEWLQHGGRVGMVTQQSFMFLPTYENLRGQLASKMAIETIARLGTGAFEEVSGEKVNVVEFVLRKEPRRLTRISGVVSYVSVVGSEQKQFDLATILEERQGILEARQADIDTIPRRPWVFWIPAEVRDLFQNNQSLSAFAETRIGLQTSDNFRFIRFWWEVGCDAIEDSCQSFEEAISSPRKWFQYSKGGSSVKWFGNLEYVVNWQRGGEELRNWIKSASGKPYSNIWMLRKTEQEFFFRPGITWTRIGMSRLNARYLPKGYIFDMAGSCIFPKKNEIMPILGILNSELSDYLFRTLNPTVTSGAGDMDRLPIAKSALNQGSILSSLVQQAIALTRRELLVLEEWKEFSLPGQTLTSYPAMADETKQNVQDAINHEVFGSYGIRQDLVRQKPFNEVAAGLQDGTRESEVANDEGAHLPTDGVSVSSNAVSDSVRWLSYAVGIVLGRFQPGVDGALGSAIVEDEEGGRTHQFSSEVEEALRGLADGDGIAPLDAGHPDDLATKVERALELMLGADGAAEVIEQGAKRKTRTFLEREYWQKYHLKWYRKRPPYWLLQSPKKLYGLYLFHERVTRDTLFVVQRRYVDPKLTALGHRIDELRAERDTASGRARTAKQRELDALEAQRADVAEFGRRLREITERGYDPDIDDGVILNLAPLGEVLPSWSAEPKKYWEGLERGDYDWAHMAMQHWPERVLAKCRTDKSLAIAHGRLDLYEDGAMLRGEAALAADAEEHGSPTSHSSAAPKPRQRAATMPSPDIPNGGLQACSSETPSNVI